LAQFKTQSSTVQGEIEQPPLFCGKGKREGFLSSGIAHLRPGFTHGVENLFFGSFAGEGPELKFEEHKTESVFENLAIGVVGKILFQIQVADFGDDFGGATGFAQDGLGFIGVELFEVVAPAEVARSCHGVFFARDHPAAQVLAAGGEAEGFGCVGRQFQDPIGQTPGVEKLARTGGCAVEFDVGVARVFGVESGDGVLQGVHDLVRGRRHSPSEIFSRPSFSMIKSPSRSVTR